MKRKTIKDVATQTIMEVLLAFKESKDETEKYPHKDPSQSWLESGIVPFFLVIFTTLTSCGVDVLSICSNLFTRGLLVIVSLTFFLIILP